MILTGFCLFPFCGLCHADDCGLRGFDGSQIVHFECEEGTPTSCFRVTTPSGETRGVVLVDIDQPEPPDPVFVKNKADGTPVIKALGHISPASPSTCEELQMIDISRPIPLMPITIFQKTLSAPQPSRAILLTPNLCGEKVIPPVFQMAGMVEQIPEMKASPSLSSTNLGTKDSTPWGHSMSLTKTKKLVGMYPRSFLSPGHSMGKDMPLMIYTVACRKRFRRPLRES